MKNTLIVASILISGFLTCPLTACSKELVLQKVESIRVGAWGQKFEGTEGGLLLRNAEETENSDGSVNIKIDVKNPQIMDSLLEIRDKSGKVVQLKLIEGTPLSENLFDGFIDTGKAYFQFLQNGSLDPKMLRAKETNLSFTLEKGETAVLSSSSDYVLFVNYITALLKSGGVLLDATGSDSKSSIDYIMSFAIEWLTSPENQLIVDSLSKKDASDKTAYLSSLNTKESWKILQDFALYLTKIKSSSPDGNHLEVAESILDSPVIKPFAELVAENVVKRGALNVLELTPKMIDSSPLMLTAEVIYGASKGVNIFQQFNQAAIYHRNPQKYSFVLKENFNPESTQEPGLMLAYTSCTTQVSSSHIGSASCSFQVPNQPIQNESQAQNFASRGIGESTQQANQYTNGQIVKVPLDIGLTWNQNTKLDLDSHLVTPNGEHIYFSQRGNLNEAPNAFLYRDSIPNGGLKGAEQTRITQFQDGQYRFYVYNYSDSTGQEAARITGPNGLSNSGATVKLYEGGATLTNVPNDPAIFDLNNPNVQKVGNPYPGDSTFNVPTNQPGNTWYVFRLDTRTGILTRVDRLGNAPNSSGVPNVR